MLQRWSSRAGVASMAARAATRHQGSSVQMTDSNEVIGVDLGTTYSCVAILEGETPKIVENAEGFRTTPSVVGFKGNEKLVGATAKRQLVTNPSSTFYAVKRLIGRRFDDEKTKQDMKTMPYKIVKHTNGDAWVEDGNGRQYSPSQIGGFVLEKMKQTAEARLGKRVSRAVITCPAYFNDSQRQATKDAGAIAGLTVERVINEPTAAALAFGIKADKEKQIIVYDLGGGTFDVSVLNIAGGVFAVNATNGDTHLGGEDFDIALQEYILKEFKKTSGMDLSSNKMAVQRVREAAEKAKCELSSATQTEVNLPFLAVSETEGPQNLQMTITRAQLEEVCAPLIERTLGPCKRCLRDSGIDKDEITEVVLVGGMTRMPKVGETVTKFFGKEPFRGVNPDEAVAMGAAIQGGVLKGKVSSLVLLDVTPLTLGFELEGGIFKRVIPKNTTIPCKRTVETTTVSDNQTTVLKKVYQGERDIAADNKYLGEFTLTGIPACPRGVPKIETTFDLDANGICRVTARDKATGKSQSISIQSNGGLSKDEVEKMIQQSKLYEKTDKLRREAVEAKNEAERHLHTAETEMTKWKHVGEEDKKAVKSLVSELRTVLENPNSTKDNLTEASEKLNKAVMECGKTEYQAQAAQSK